jgi:prepilin peptidase CpaA
MLVMIEILLLAGLAVLLCIAALGDIRSYRIPNKLNLIIASLAIPYWLLNITALNAGLLPQLLLIGIMLIILLPLMLRSILGGGDAKLLFALSFWFKPSLYFAMIMVTVIAGGILCLGVLLRGRLQSPAPNIGINGEVVESKRKQRIPYGVAIAAGGLVPVSQLILNALMA